MQLVDSHCHLDRIDLTPFGGEFRRFVDATRDGGVSSKEAKAKERRAEAVRKKQARRARRNGNGNGSGAGIDS